MQALTRAAACPALLLSRFYADFKPGIDASNNLTMPLTPPQAVKVAALKQASPSFVVTRQFAMRFRGILRGNDPEKLGQWLIDARTCGISSMKRFAQTLSRDLDAVKNAEIWSNGQAEGQINRLKALKRAMYGRAGTQLLRARMLPLEST